MSFRRRTYPEVLDHVLTSIAGGVAGESHPFPPPGSGNGGPYRHSLESAPVATVVSVYGTRNGATHRFGEDRDFQLAGDRIEWLEGADLPDEGTLLRVTYVPSSAEPAVTDLQSGSVVRTMAESVALEIAGLYAQLQAVYDAGFIETASGSALDKVVALLGLRRVPAGRAAGEVELTRSPGIPGVITVPAGTRILTADGEVEYETLQTVTLDPGQTKAKAPARDIEPANDPLPAESLTLLPVPIAGISAVTNPAPTSFATRAETDTELRERARNFLHGSERATPGALSEVLARQGVKAEVIEDPEKPGHVTVTPHAEELSPEARQRLLQAIEDTRPAGVKVIVTDAQPPRKVDLELVLTTGDSLVEAQRRAAHDAVRTEIQSYFAELPAKAAGSVSRLVGRVMSIAEVEDVRLLDASWTVGDHRESVLDREKGELAVAGFFTALGELAVADPGLPSLLELVVTFPAGEAPPDEAALEGALRQTVLFYDAINAVEIPADLDQAARAAEEDRRTVAFGKLLLALPLPGKPATALADYDAAVAAGNAPELPKAADVAPYAPKLVISRPGGLSRVLSGDGDAHPLVPFERLSVADVVVEEEEET